MFLSFIFIYFLFPLTLKSMAAHRIKCVVLAPCSGEIEIEDLGAAIIYTLRWLNFKQCFNSDFILQWKSMAAPTTD